MTADRGTLRVVVHGAYVHALKKVMSTQCATLKGQQLIFSKRRETIYLRKQKWIRAPGAWDSKDCTAKQDTFEKK